MRLFLVVGALSFSVAASVNDSFALPERSNDVQDAGSYSFSMKNIVMVSTTFLTLLCCVLYAAWFCVWHCNSEKNGKYALANAKVATTRTSKTSNEVRVNESKRTECVRPKNSKQLPSEPESEVNVEPMYKIESSRKEEVNEKSQSSSITL